MPYGSNNPLLFTDPDGLIPLAVAGGGAAGGGAAGGLGGLGGLGGASGGLPASLDPENPYSGPGALPLPSIPMPSLPEGSLPGMLLNGCKAIVTSASDLIMQMAKGKKKPSDVGNSDDEDSGHTKGKRQSTKDKHEKGDERRLRDKGGEKKDQRMRY